MPLKETTMSDPFVEWIENNNIKPIKIDIKKKLLFDISYIERSWTGRTDAQIANTFILEAAQLLVNSLILFEKGYFDCAYYSLRQSPELSTTMIYLSDIPEKERIDKTNAWKTASNFPMQGKMLKYLNENGFLFADMKTKMKVFFDDLFEFNKKLNKFVHKQGFRYFYVSRNQPASQLNVSDFTNAYISHLKKCIGTVAVLRLAIDPFPILLLDEEMYHRSFEPLTESYSEEFVDEYIGTEVLEQYKLTDVFLGLYNAIMQDEKRNVYTTNIIKFHFIDTSNLESINNELHLLNPIDVVAVKLVEYCLKVVNVYNKNTFGWYSTDRQSHRISTNYSSNIFKNLEETKTLYNIVYEEVFLSVVQSKNEYFYIEHNELLFEQEYIDLCNKINSLD